MKTVTLPGYELQSVISEGGVGVVWKAKQLSLSRTVAIKILPASKEEDRVQLEIFQEEARVMASLKHPGIVQVYEAGSCADHYFIVMEFVAGYSVLDWIERKEKLSVADTLVVGEYVTEALWYAWEKRPLT